MDSAGSEKKRKWDPIRAVVFDLDGTLLDTLTDIGDAVNQTLQQLGLPTHPHAAYRYFVGDGWKMLVTRALPEDRRSAETIARVAGASHDAYQHSWDRHTAAYPGIAELLDALSGRGCRLAVLSNKPHPDTVRCVASYFDRWPFDPVLGQSERFPPKPDPAGALAVSRHIGIPPAACLYLGDSGVDMQTAVGAGMLPVGALWGFRDAAELEAHGCRHLVNYPLDVIDLVASSPV